MKTNFIKIITCAFALLSLPIWATEPSGTPILRLETGMHTNSIRQISVDAQERFLLTTSMDKTAKLWDLATGELLTTYRPPIGEGNEGKLYTGAISPDGEWVAVGGWTGDWEDYFSIYLFNRSNGRLIKRLYGLPEVVARLCFSPDGQYLAASLLGNNGIRVWETQQWVQVFSDAQYNGDSYSCQFDTQNRLVTTSLDGYVRLYATDGNKFSLVTQTQPTGGKLPSSVRFSPNADRIAVGFGDSTQLNILDGQTLALLEPPDMTGIDGKLYDATWSMDNRYLCSGGGYNKVRCWSLPFQQGNYVEIAVATSTISGLYFLKNGELVYSTYDPNWGVFDNTGKKRLEHVSPIADFRGNPLLVSYDGSNIQFGLTYGERPSRFSLSPPSLQEYPPVDTTLLAPDTESLKITDWKDNIEPKLNDSPLSLDEYETSRSLAIAPDKSSFLLGTEWYLRLFDAAGEQKWQKPVNVAWQVNISGDGQKVIAALGDGTIRWYSMATGEELLAFFPHVDGKQWIAWTPSGYYMSSGEGAENLLGWHVNHGREQAASLYPVGQKYSSIYKRPEVVQRILITLGEKEALEALAAETKLNEPPTKPILRLETGMHTGLINQISVDAQERFLLTTSYDKTARLWDLGTGQLLTTYRPPIGRNDEGRLDAGAISPDGEWVAVGGWTGYEWEESLSIYLFNRSNGRLIKRLYGLPAVIGHLCFSPDGRYLAASLLGNNGIRIWETQQWNQVFSDSQYEGGSYNCQFDPQNRLVTTSYDGYVRLYATDGTQFNLIAQTQPTGGKEPQSATFSPNGNRIAVGFSGTIQLNILDGQTLATLETPDMTGINGELYTTAWSTDNQRLCAGGGYGNYQDILIRCWSLPFQQGGYAEWVATTGGIFDLHFLKNGDLVYGSSDPRWGVFDSTGKKRLEHASSIADFRGNSLLVSYDGSNIQFGLTYGERPSRFSLSPPSLQEYPPVDTTLLAPDTESLKITDWKDNIEPKLNDSPLSLDEYETSRSLAIAPDKSSFLLGTSWYLRLFDAAGKQKWQKSVNFAWRINISGDGQKAIAALGDGTIRWYSMATGEELLAFFPHIDGKRWIAWTPSGYYMSSGEGAENLLGWHVNQDKEQEAKFYPISALQTEFKRSDIVRKVLDTLIEDKAVLVANLEKDIDAKPLKTTRQRLDEIAASYEVKTTPSGLGKAVIVAASGPQSNKNTLFPYTNRFAERMYNILYKKGFSDEDIFYINPYPPAVPYGNYEDIQRQDARLQDPFEELQQALTQVASELKAGQQFVFYLHGHAGYQSIRLRLGDGNRPSVDLSAQQLKDLLAQIPKDVYQIIILDTCHSGSFLSELSGVPNRMVITSADSDSLAWSNETNSFANSFLKTLESDSVNEAFKQAKSDILEDTKTFGNQSPQLDDNQDGLYSGDTDGQFAKNIYLGSRFGENKVHASIAPTITEVHPTIYLSPQEITATLWIKTSVDMNTVNKVQAILTNENDKPTEYQGENTQFTRREITLVPNYEKQRFEADYTGFQVAKEWRIFYQVETIEGEWSDIEVGYVRSDVDNSLISLKTTMNQSTYRAGDPFRFEVAAFGEGNVDLYVGFVFPDGSYYTIGNPFVFSEKNKLVPYQQNLQLTGEQTQSVSVMELGAGLLPTLFIGNYQACGLLTKANSNPEDASTWLKLDCYPFQFLPN